MENRYTTILLALGSLAVGPTAAVEYPRVTAEPQKTDWPLTEEGRAYVLKPEHDRRPGRESNKYLPQLWPVVPSASFWGGTAWLDAHAKLVDYVKANAALDTLTLDSDSKMHVLDLWNDFANADGTLKKPLFTPDSIHLSLEGYAVYAERLKPLLDKFIGATAASSP